MYLPSSLRIEKTNNHYEVACMGWRTNIGICDYQISISTSGIVQTITESELMKTNIKVYYLKPGNWRVEKFEIFSNVERSPVIGLVVETQCRYFSQIAFPSIVHAGLRVAHLGNSVRYDRSACSETIRTPPLRRATSCTYT